MTYFCFIGSESPGVRSMEVLRAETRDAAAVEAEIAWVAIPAEGRRTSSIATSGY